MVVYPSMIFDNIEAYAEPLIFFLIAILALRTWSATQVKQTEIEETAKNARSKTNVDGKVASDRYSALAEMRMLVADGEGEEGDLGSMMKMLEMVGGKTSPGVNPQDTALMGQLEAFAQTPEGADAMIKFNSFQSK